MKETVIGGLVMGLWILGLEAAVVITYGGWM